MKKITLLNLSFLSVALLSACGAPPGNAPAANANAANTAAKTAPAAPTKDGLVAAENKAWGSWKAKDGTFFIDYLTDNAIGMGNNGRSDKAAIIKRISDPTCEVNDFKLSEERMTTLGADAALLTYRATQDAKCGGKALPATVRAATVLVRSGDKWKAAFHAEAAIVDPKAAPAKRPGEKEIPQKAEERRAAPDAGTDALVSAEKAVWEAWKDHDGKRIEELTAKDISFINIFGTFFPTKADAIKDWSATGCEVKSVSVSDGVSTMFSPTVGLLTFKGGADGTCFGQKVGPIWGTSIYIKEGDTWKWTFGINLPAD